MVRYCTRVFLLMYILDNIDGFSKMWNLIMWVCFTILWHCFKLFLCLIYQSLSTIVIWKWNFRTPKNLKSKTTRSYGKLDIGVFFKKKKKMSHLSAAFSFPRKKIRRIPVPFLSSILASLGAVIFISLVLGFWNFKMICLSASLFHPL